MALTNESMVMPVAPMYGGNNGNGLLGGGDNWLGILFLIGLLNGGMWGGFGGGYGAMMGMGMWGMDGLYPWLNNSQNINSGFRDQMLNSTINGIQNSVTSGFGDVQTALCGGFAGVNQNISSGTAAIQNSLCNGFNGVNQSISGAQNAITQQMYTNQIADMERSYAAQTANTAGITNVSNQISQIGYANSAASAQNTRDIIDAQTRGTQAILDKLCALELDGVKGQLAQAQRDNAVLQNAVNMATMRESQTAQTAQILAGQAAEIDGVYNRLKNCPVGTYPVCNPNIYPAQNFNNSGCGCNGGF